MLDRLNSLSEIIKNLAIAGGVSLLGIYAIVSIWGNIAINQTADPESGYPSKSKAPHEITITTTGQKLFTKKYEVVKKDEPQIYSLPSGYYYLTDGQADFTKEPLTLDEYIWGDIEVRKR